MNPCTDEDLKRLKEWLRLAGAIYIENRNVTDEIKALIARLEAAELLCDYTGCDCRFEGTPCHCGIQKLKKDWRKAAGKG